jgi:hypothetical protein
MHDQSSNDSSRVATPAPWRVIPTAEFDGTKHVAIAEAGDLCVVADRRAFDKAQIPANHQLVAAAPDLLAVCRAVLGFRNVIFSLAAVYKKAHEAVEKATGEVPPDTRFALTEAGRVALDAEEVTA